MQMMTGSRFRGLWAGATILVLGVGCGSSDSETPAGSGGSAGSGGADASTALCEGDANLTRPSWWSKKSHCPKQNANYDKVFDETVVHRVDIVISAADKQKTYDDLDKNYSSSASGADLDALPTPIWIPATISYDSKQWTQVGLRWKGHASLKGAWLSGIRKLSFVLSFDHYEADHPELENQRFYGFKKLSFSNGYRDPSLLREKTAASIFRAAGVPAARSVFAPVYMDWGEGSFYLGLYTMVEDPADQMIENQIAGDAGTTDSGNLYKPWGVPAKWLSLAEVPQADVETYFEKETNETTSDWTDVLAALNALHADRTDAATWRSNLEKVFDVQAFLKATAVNQVIVNWDSYGCMHHNYLVYANPDNGGRFLWMPWDLNESMKNVEQEGCPAPGSVFFDEILKAEPTAELATWPLIRFLLSDEKYLVDYRTFLQQVLDGPFVAETVIAQMRKDHDLIAPYVVGPTATETAPRYTNTTPDKFNNSLTSGDDALEPHVAARRSAVEAALKGQ